ncbi:helix-turn-helix domain-containing protein [Actinokineospora spheciospongiae]|uniref:helix-turn-helix domain-containing protein n=1 Tax=Actinokineospora spheciospongiae TaxID=909613 RepID=UPI000D71A14D|nr:Scr1 family TA system antitoxin-like transcriptional regulator [Actinokineospora spheciospongiae]PWW59579.1 helix-turn-helix protein [Actinokineospora spheciospongiae]
MSTPTTTASATAEEPGARAKTLRGLLLARELDAARQKQGFTTRALAAGMSMSPAMLNRVMTGRRVPTALEIGGLCSLLDIHPARRHHLYRLTANADLTDWLLPTNAEENPIGQIEAIAETITWFASHLIPQPLRTTAYNNAITTAAHPTPTAASAQTTGISMFLLHPQTLHHPGVPTAVSREQLYHLRDTHPHKIRLLPTTIPPEPSFRVLDIDHFPPIVHIEHHNTTILMEHPTATATHTAFLHHAKAVSLTVDHTRELLASAGVSDLRSPG